jgi:Domain of unknown function (DUF4422)
MQFQVDDLMGGSSLKILVCHYRDVYIRSSNPAYLDIQCGKDATGLDLGMQGDDTGDNISARNSYWSEITGLYWAWKNMEPADYVGLCSYRRFFNFKSPTKGPVQIIPLSRGSEVEAIDMSTVVGLLERYDIIVPEPYTYAYSIRRVCSMNYVDRDFDLLEQLVYEVSPEYGPAYRHIFYETNKMIGHNMFILPWDRFQEYCKWVFSILLRLEMIIDPSCYPIRQVRVFGYMHEILLGVFIEHHQLKQYHSQITWLSNDHKKFKFNSALYRLMATGYYKAVRAWAGDQYQHKLSSTAVRK